MNELEQLEELKKLAMQLVASKKKFNKLSEKRSSMSMSTHTQKAIETANANLDWHAMSHDQLKHTLHAACVDCGLAAPRDHYEPVDYRPSGFHHYQHQPRLPLCRQEAKS